MTTEHVSSPLIEAAALVELVAQRRPLRIFDVSFDLADTAAGERAYASGHVPGAHHLDLERHLADHTPAPDHRPRGRHPLPSRAAFAATLGRFGVDATLPVVVYDRSQGMFAARAWWMLRWLGHRDVALLDGGWSAWLAAGGSVDTEAPVPPLPALYVPAPPLAHAVDVGMVQRGLGHWRLIDARAPERFRGEVEPLDPVAGHIPGALNRPFKLNLAPDGRFRTADELRTDFTALLGSASLDTVVHQCGSGVTACHNLLAMEVAGLSGTVLYPGSWSEWCADPARPVSRT